jgi:hypothetical protein
VVTGCGNENENPPLDSSGNKIHIWCRKCTLGQSNDVSSETRLHYTCTMKDLLESRNLGETMPCDIPEEIDLKGDLASHWHPPHKQLSTEWGEMLLPTRSWPSPTPESGVVGVHAWSWLREWEVRQLGATEVPASHGRLSQLLSRSDILKNKINNYQGIVMANGVYAFHAVPIRTATVGANNMHCFSLNCISIDMQFVYNLVGLRHAWES